jgi:DNA-binding FadR family transcriptional regulator
MGTDSELFGYLAGRSNGPGERLPSINELARQLGISASKLREQLEVARALGLLEVRPKTGIRTREFSYLPALRMVILLALAKDPSGFDEIRELRTQLEADYWEEAVARLQPADVERLQQLVAQAEEKLHGTPIQIPHAEHKALHLTVFSRLPNSLVRALLEAYWEAYEAVGLSLYADYAYLREVWAYHAAMVEAIRRGDVDAGRRALIDHTGLLRARPAGGDRAAEAGGQVLAPVNWRGDLG